MSRKQRFFDEKTILKTPNPIHSSSMSRLDHIPERLSDIDIPLVTNSFDLSPVAPASSTPADQLLKYERMLALNSLNRIDSIEPKELTSLPSKYLRPSDLPETPYSQYYFNSESTISESDLLPENSSTPRESVLSKVEFVMKEPSRGSRGQSLIQLANSLRSENLPFNKMMETISKSMDLEYEGTFCSGAKALEKLDRDEMSWKREKDIPAKIHDFSLGQSADSKLSVGSFFKQRSDNLSTLLAKSPEKNHAPVALIEESTCKDDTVEEKFEKSLSISAIGQLIQDPKNTPNRLLELFENKKEKSLPPRKSTISEYKPSTSPVFETDKENKNISSTVFDVDKESFKENIDTLNVKDNLSPSFPQDKTSISSRSSSALSSLPNGKLPVGTTRSELIWGCVKLGKTVTQDFVIKNKSSSKVSVKCTLTNPSFKLISEGSIYSLQVVLHLHPFESRNMKVAFGPSSIGAAVDYIHFTSTDPNHVQSSKQFIRLFGYGGFGNITFHNIWKEMSGKLTLALGSIDEKKIIEKTFVLKNAGTLPSFAYIEFAHSDMFHLFSNVTLSKKTAILLPGEETEVAFACQLKVQSLNFLIQTKRNCPVIDIGKVSVIHGTEVDRGRLRRLCAKAREGGVPLPLNLDSLTEKFPGEAMPPDLKLMKESTASKEEILRLLNHTNILITIEHNLDRTAVEQLQNETASFISLCENTTMLQNNVANAVDFVVEPSEIILTPPLKINDLVFIKNNTDKETYFEARSVPEGLVLKPREGTVEIGETVVVQVGYDKVPDPKTAFTLKTFETKNRFQVKIFIGNDVYEVNVKINSLIVGRKA